jgi:hypothetical protein
MHATGNQSAGNNDNEICTNEIRGWKEMVEIKFFNEKEIIINK